MLQWMAEIVLFWPLESYDLFKGPALKKDLLQPIPFSRNSKYNVIVKQAAEIILSIAAITQKK